MLILLLLLMLILMLLMPLLLMLLLLLLLLLLILLLVLLLLLLVLRLLPTLKGTQMSCAMSRRSAAGRERTRKLIARLYTQTSVQSVASPRSSLEAKGTIRKNRPLQAPNYGL